MKLVFNCTCQSPDRKKALDLGALAYMIKSSSADALEKTLHLLQAHIKPAPKAIDEAVYNPLIICKHPCPISTTRCNPE